MAVAATALTTLDNARAALGIASGDTSKNSLIEQYIDRATAQIESMTERKLKARRYNGAGEDTHDDTGIDDEDYVFFSGHTLDNGGDAVIDPNGYGVFHLPQYPVQPNDDTTFVLGVLTARSGGEETWDTSALTEWDDYVVEREKGILRLTGGRFTPGYRNYRITMAAGYPTIPADLEQLCIALVKKMFRNEAGVTSESLGTWSKSYDVSKADEYINATLAKYRRLTL